jgi:hypothetical protein
MPRMTADPHATGHEVDEPGHADAVAHHRTDDHAHASEALGPVDVYAWGAGILGIVVAIVIAFTLALSTSLG